LSYYSNQFWFIWWRF